MTSNSTRKSKRVYGRRTGRPLNVSRRSALDELLPGLELDENQLTEKGDLAPETLFDFAPSSVWLEIGFGNGEHLTALMERYPDYGFLGAEPFINGMAAFLKDIKDSPHKNVRVLMDDAMMIANSLTDASVDGIYVLNPDPWHKARHHKRRIINEKNLDVFARILKKGGQLVISTDVPNLAEWMYDHTKAHRAFKQTNEDMNTPPDGWIKTRYEGKGAKGADKMVYMIFEKCK